MKCPKCGYAKNAEGAVLCNLCGDVLPQPQAPTTVSAPPSTPSPPTVKPPGRTAPAPAPAVSPAGPTDVYRTSYVGAPQGEPDTATATPPPDATGGIASFMEGGVCHLKCSLLDRPLRLRPDRPVQIGRGGDNDIVIPSQMVSRKHGKVFFENRVWVYQDLGSSNGSRVNGKREDRHVLQSGDVIDLGGFLVTYKEIHDLSDVSAEGAEEGKTMAIDANMLKKVAMAGMDGVALLGGMGGSLADISIPDILQLMEMQRKSGTLTLDFDGAMGKIHMSHGNMVHAEYGKLTGETAVYRMLKNQKGSFHFDPREPRVEPTIGRPTTSVLLDASREMDEGGR